MDKRELKIEYHVYTGEWPDRYEELCQKAIDASKNAYSIYSKFSVGAALLLNNGEIVTGSNQENIAYPSGLCAERTALFYASSSFPDNYVEALAIVAFNHGKLCDDAITPCGACRQVMAEMIRRTNRDFDVVMMGLRETIVIKASALLPFSFEISGYR